MAKTVVLIGTLDTKGPEIAYLRDRLQEFGLSTIVIDSGILGEPLEILPDIPHEQSATYAGSSLEAMRSAGSRGKAVGMMRESLQNLALKLYQEGRLDAAVSMGGAEGAIMGAAAMMVLPVGVPKVLVSPIASGHHYFAPLVGTKDMMVVHSVVDILGLNSIACSVFDNVAAALSGMVEHGHGLPEPKKRNVAITMLGNTTIAVMEVKKRLENAGYEAVIFHSNGVGGPAMEELAEQGQFVGIIDYTTNEVYDPLVGGIHDGGPDRLEVAGRLGLPQVVLPGCIDFSVWNTGTVPESLRDRPMYDHNPEYVLVRASGDEMEELGRIFARKLNQAKGDVVVMVPTEGLSIPNTPGGVFWDPDADSRFLGALKQNLRTNISVDIYDCNVNDPLFGEAVADVFIQLMDNQKT
ncbi:MAG: Tm-1-like ATP-binding domain-containing protein [Bacteroidetes bacterium]|nr:Tm-1-like ATP-binding domain-containing protein [Bacteroidota bacterium]MCY4204688.1 Tm-1-like ATP-binding domain-containing protein [Bacteroidota bacterium]